jgi:hypothetical protein
VLRSDKVDVVTLGLVLQLQHKVRNLFCLHTRDQLFSPVLRIRIRIILGSWIRIRIKVASWIRIWMRKK